MVVWGPVIWKMPGTKEGHVANRAAPLYYPSWKRGKTHLPRLYEELSGLAFRRAAKFSESRMTCDEETKQFPWLLTERDSRL